MTKCLGMSCGGPYRSTKFQQSTLPPLRICMIMLWQVFEQVTETLMTSRVIQGNGCGHKRHTRWYHLMYALCKWCGFGGWEWDGSFRLSRSKTEYISVISVLPRKRGMLDSIVRWYPRKTHFATWDQCSRRMGISMKMLVIELKSIG
jgi:hypothetical protein